MGGHQLHVDACGGILISGARTSLSSAIIYFQILNFGFHRLQDSKIRKFCICRLFHRRNCKSAEMREDIIVEYEVLDGRHWKKLIFIWSVYNYQGPVSSLVFGKWQKIIFASTWSYNSHGSIHLLSYAVAVQNWPQWKKGKSVQLQIRTGPLESH